MKLLYQRPAQRTEIRYILITDAQSIPLPFLPPAEFDFSIVEYISRLPKDVLQIGKPLPYYENCLRVGVNNPYRFHVKYAVNLLEYLNYLEKNVLCLFFIDSRSVLLKEVVNQLQEYHTDLHFYQFYNLGGDYKTTLENIIGNPSEFLKAILDKQKKIFELMGLQYKPIVPEEIDYDLTFLEFPNFSPAQTNYWIANSIIGNFFKDGTGKDGDCENKNELNSSEIRKNHESAHSFIRQQAILKQIKKVDTFALICFKEGLIKQVHEIEPFFPPLILVAPFQNPDIKDYFQNKKGFEDIYKLLSESLDLEQSENYINFGKINNHKELGIFSHLITSKNKFLDDVALLHSSFSFSPIVRLPVQGKSIYKNLSFFRTEALTAISHPKNKAGLVKTIKRFGKQLRERTISPELTKTISTQNRQIVAISDLPIEWLNIDGIPLAFTHDICRLPETSLSGLMATYATNEQFEFYIPKDILKKTLVVFGSDEPAFKLWRPVVNELAHSAGFATRLCLSRSDLQNAMEEIQPVLLIFDCHGGYDKETKSSVLFLGNEQLTGEDIVINNISAPLVFLSACNTSPTYGTINTIANAFFENKSLSVTTTYLPINVNAGSILYIRMLANLQLASTNAIHSNWLAFVSHLIRTSAVSAAYEYFLKREKTKIRSKKIADSQATLFKKLLSFYLRRKIFNEIDSTFKDLSGQDRVIFSNIIPEYLFYSNLGRSDLVRFESWYEKYTDINKM